MTDKTKETTPTPVAGTGKISISPEELQNLIAQAVAANQSQNTAISAKVLADAILESRKPYKSDEQLANEEQQRATMRLLRDRQEQAKKFNEDNCPHLQGCNELSERTGELSSILHHQNDLGEMIGICTNCQRIFKPGDTDYMQQMRRKSGNKMSQAGQRFHVGI